MCQTYSCGCKNIYKWDFFCNILLIELIYFAAVTYGKRSAARGPVHQQQWQGTPVHKKEYQIFFSSNDNSSKNTERNGTDTFIDDDS